MLKLLMCMGAVLAAAAAFGVTLDELNVARDPETLDGAIYATAVFSTKFRTGPGTYFAAIDTVPAGTEVPVVGWVSAFEEEEGFWVRIWYGGQRGWLCAYADGERLLERNGGPLFTVTAGEDIADNYFGKRHPAPGDILEVVWFQDPYWLNTWGLRDVEFRVKYDGDRALLRAYREEEASERPRVFDVKPPAPAAAGWTVGFDAEFAGLNLTYDYERCDFVFLKPEDNGVYSGPGYEFGEIQHFAIPGYVLFVEGEWALVDYGYTWGWNHIGTDEDPSVQMRRAIPHFQEGKGLEPETDGYAAVYDDYWPSANAVYLEFVDPYFAVYYTEKLTVREASFYQPPDAEKPLYVNDACEGEKGGAYEALTLTYAFDVPASLDRDAPFRIATKMSLDGSEEFDVDFHCNPSREY